MANDFLIRECDQWLSKCGNLRDSEFNSRLSRRTGKHSRPNRQGQTIYDVKTDQIEAAFDNGFVTITIPKNDPAGAGHTRAHRRRSVPTRAQGTR